MLTCKKDNVWPWVIPSIIESACTDTHGDPTGGHWWSMAVPPIHQQWTTNRWSTDGHRHFFTWLSVAMKIINLETVRTPQNTIECVVPSHGTNGYTPVEILFIPMHGSYDHQNLKHFSGVKTININTNDISPSCRIVKFARSNISATNLATK